MTEVLVKFTTPVKGEDGRLYKAEACGGVSEDGLWEGWIEFSAETSDLVYRSARETTQPNRNDLLYWAKGLTEVYLEGALKRALGPTTPLAPPDESVPGDFPSRAPGRPLTTDVAARAAEWLKLVDALDARGSWEATGESFRSAVAPEEWASQLTAVRKPLGTLTSRIFAVEETLNDLPDEPPGKYVVRQYHAVYDGRQAVTETVTLRQETDGEWRVVGYFIR